MFFSSLYDLFTTPDLFLLSPTSPFACLHCMVDKKGKEVRVMKKWEVGKNGEEQREDFISYTWWMVERESGLIWAELKF